MRSFEKREISLRYWLQGREFYRAAEALELMLSIHTGTRKDLITPEGDHQITIAHYLRSLPIRSDLQEDVLITALLHDTPEDYPQLVTRKGLVERFGERPITSVYLLNKNDEYGRLRPSEEVFEAISQDEIASIVKAGDRFHNLSSMVQVFTPAKQIAYCDYAETYILPMMKKARRRFPHHEPVYENLKFVIETQIATVRDMRTG